LGHGFLRFIITLSLVGSFMGTIKVVSSDQVLSHNAKLWFNSIITGLSMALGLSVAEAFKRMTVDIRWWILSRKKRSLSEVSDSHIMFD
jgi:ribose/xylose/arabinose/galactoside ABC-type transport system permease subunit